MTTQIVSRSTGSSLIRRVFRSNAIFSAASGAILVVAPGPLATLFGITTPAIFTLLGVALLVFAAALFWLAGRESISRPLILTVALLDAGWVLISVVGLLANWFPVSTEGKWIILIVADVVALACALEFYSLWRMREG